MGGTASGRFDSQLLLPALWLPFPPKVEYHSMQRSPSIGECLSFAMLITSVLWAAQSMAQTQPGDPVRGQQLAIECFACHGADGNSPSPVNPKIGGQHEHYLMLALEAYLNGSRSDSLMRGAVLNKSEQDLRDIAAYYAGQPSDLPSGEPQSGAAGAPGGPAGVIRFDHGERTAAFTSLLATAESLAAASSTSVGIQACEIFQTDAPAVRDTDRDGLVDIYDAAPQDAGEFVADTNEDGRFEICNIHQLDAISRLGTVPGKRTSLTVR